MADVIDLGVERNKREAPDPEFVRRDDFGRPLYCYLLSYDLDGSSYSLELFAYSQEDAEARVHAIRESLRYDGQLFGIVSA